VRQVRGIGPFLRNVRDSESSPNSIVRGRGNQGQAMFVVLLGTIREWAYSDGFSDCVLRLRGSRTPLVTIISARKRRKDGGLNRLFRTRTSISRPARTGAGVRSAAFELHKATSASVL